MVLLSAGRFLRYKIKILQSKVNLSYGYDESSRALYFHGAKAGLKIDFLKTNSHVCLTIIDDRGYLP